MNDASGDPIVGTWCFPKDNHCTLTHDGNVMLCGSRVGLWKRVEERKYMIAYLRGHFDGASDPLEIAEDGKSMRGLACGTHTRMLDRVELGKANDPHSIVGVWDYKNGNITTFTPDGWVELCGFRIGIWVKEGERTFLHGYFRGYFGGASDQIELNEDGGTAQGLIYGCWETKILSRVA